MTLRRLEKGLLFGFALGLVLAAPAPAQEVAQAVGGDQAEEFQLIRRPFEVRPGVAPGFPSEADGFRFDVHAKGPIEVRAEWEAPQSLTLSLWPPLDAPPVIRKGDRPLVVKTSVKGDHLEDGSAWRVKIDGPVTQRTQGTLLVRYPSGRSRGGILTIPNVGSVAFNEKGQHKFFADRRNDLARLENLPQDQVFLMMTRSPTSEEKQGLRRHGIDLLEPLSPDVFRAVVGPSQDRELEALEFKEAPGLVRGIADVRNEHKIDPRIELDQFSRFAVNFKGHAGPSYMANKNDGTVNVLASFLPNTSDVEIKEILKRSDATEKVRIDAHHRILALKPRKIERLAADELVKSITPPPPPALPENDFSRRIIQAEPIQDFHAAHLPPTYHLGGGGDLDLLLGDKTGRVFLAVNDGTITSHAFRKPGAIRAGNADLKVQGRASPTLADIDGDGDLDLFVGDAMGHVFGCENQGTDAAPVYAAPQPVAAEGAPLSIGTVITPVFWDLDHDGDRDMVVGSGDGGILWLKNTGTFSKPAFAAPQSLPRAGGGNVRVSSDAVPRFEDCDGDGRYDLVVGDGDGGVQVFLNRTTHDIIEFGAGAPLLAGGVPIDVGAGASPAFCDLDGDRDDDLVVGSSDSTLWFFENTGGTGGFSFRAARPLALPNVLPMLQGYASPLFYDADLDGVRVVNAEPGLANWSHRDFEGRVVCREGTPLTRSMVDSKYQGYFFPDAYLEELTNHPSHVLGTMAGSGLFSDLSDAGDHANQGTPFQWRGIAPSTGLIFLDDLQTEDQLRKAVTTFGAHVINGSFRLSQHGEYSYVNAVYDAVPRGEYPGGPPLPAAAVVLSAGNSGSFPSSNNPSSPILTGYFSLTKQCKNPIIVGNWDRTVNPEGRNGQQPGPDLRRAHQARCGRPGNRGHLMPGDDSQRLSDDEWHQHVQCDGHRGCGSRPGRLAADLRAPSRRGTPALALDPAGAPDPDRRRRGLADPHAIRRPRPCFL